MKTVRILTIVLFALAVIFSLAKVSKAAPLGTAFTYQGHLYDNNDVANDFYDFQFKLYDDPNVVIGQQIGSVVNIPDMDVIDGYFTVELDFGSTAFDGEVRWLEIGVRPGASIGAFAALSPLQEITPAPYALYAKTAGPDGDWTVSGDNMYAAVTGNVGIGTIKPETELDVVGTVNATAFTGDGSGLTNLPGITVETDPTVPASIKDGISWDELSAMPGGFADGVDDVGGDITAVNAGLGLNGGGTSGDVTLSVDVPLELSGAVAYPDTVIKGTNSSNGYGVYGIQSSNRNYGWLGGSSYGAYGRNFGSGNFGYLGGGSYAVYGSSPAGRGVYGYCGGSNDGVYGYSDTGYGVHGKQSDSGNYGYLGGDFVGAYGASGGPGNFGWLGGTIYGVFGKNISSNNIGYLGSPDEGVYGESDTGIGVHGHSESSYGVYGFSTSSYAGYFNGHVYVAGLLSKGGGSFKIDHPLDPENKYLSHSFVESPDMMNVYNGNVVLDDNGQAVIEMPDWFDALNREFRYQLTCIGGFAPVYIADKIQDNIFSIAGGTAGLEVSWQVTGIRQDPYAEKNRIQVEVDKPADERGKYLHPEAYGLGEERGVGYEKREGAVQ